VRKPEIKIEGRVHTDPATLERFSRDASSYRIAPTLVAEPADEGDVIRIMEYARRTRTGITCRSGGSGLSGAGIGSGMIVNFKPLMNRIEYQGEQIVAEPGVVLADFLNAISDRGLMLPAVPSSSAWCALGGNIGTRATGPRTARYGTIDSFVSSLRFVTASGDVVDTREELPVSLDHGIMNIRNRYLADGEARKLFGGRPFIAGGYNIEALSTYEDPRQIAAHLLVGSIGTLGVVTEIRLTPIPLRASQGTYAAFCHNLEQLEAAVQGITGLSPAAVEFLDGMTLSLLRGRLLTAENPQTAGVLLVEFDESTEQAARGLAILESVDPYDLLRIPPGSQAEQALWEERRRVLPTLWAYARERRWILPSIIDDVAIHVADFAGVCGDLRNLMGELSHEIAIFGHLGFGSLHARPYFEPERDEITRQIEEVSSGAFGLLQNYGGTLVGEHNAGRSRSLYLEKELGGSFHYLREVKDLFDPDDLLNPNTLFDLAPITQDMDLNG
jgi:FAD/FMN-containing dehydrogenase